jgi:hypothetical protein
MATLAKGGRIIKNLTPEQVGQALAEWCMVRGDIEFDGRVKVKTDYNFNHGEKQFFGARVEVVAV